MKKIIFILIIFSVLLISCSDKFGPDASDFGLPVIKITMSDHAINEINRDEGFPMKLTLVDSATGTNLVNLDGEIEGRGNSTWEFLKKPYKFKLESKESILGLTASKKWILLADFLDPTGMKNYSALNLAHDIYDDAGNYSPEARHVMVEINGKINGTYLLVEYVNANEEHLDLEDELADWIALDSINNTIINWDPSFYIEFNTIAKDTHEPFSDDFYYHDNNVFSVEIKYPDTKDRNELYADHGYIGSDDPILDKVISYVDNFFSYLENTNEAAFDALVDMESFADFMIINEFMYNNDAGGNSLKLSKKTGEKIVMGPVWDFDGAIDGWDYLQHYHNLDNTYDVDCISGAKLYDEFLEMPSAQGLVDDSIDKINDEFANFIIEFNKEANKIDKAQDLNSKIWNYNYNYYSRKTNDIFAWFPKRLAFINTLK